MTYAYLVRDPLGNEHDGSIEATSSEHAEQQLRQEGFQILSLREGLGDEQGLFPRRVTKSQIIYVTSQLAIMVDTGITLSVALQSIADEEENPTLRALLVDLRKHVEGGGDFSSALEQHPQFFNSTYVSLVRASEATGTLGEMLERISAYQRKELDARSKVRAAMMYPAVMLLLAVSVTIFLLVFVMPKFQPLFERQDAKLPLITRAMVAASGALVHYWYLWIAGGVATAVGFVWGKRTEGGAKVLDWIKIHVPIFGPMFRKVMISRSVRTLGTMIASGVSVLEAIQLSADVSGNYYYARLWKTVLDGVTGGSQIYESLASSPLFPSMLVQMIKSGEETGKLDMVLAKVSDYYDGEVDLALKTATSLIEPIMISLMGIVIGGIALGLLLPIFTLGSSPG